jgi:hypothetical protein
MISPIPSLPGFLVVYNTSKPGMSGTLHTFLITEYACILHTVYSAYAQASTHVNRRTRVIDIIKITGLSLFYVYQI